MKTLLLIVAASLCTVAHAQTYPNRPIKFVVPFPPGGNLDFVARNLQPKMQEVLGQPVVIHNKGGAAGMIGLEYAARQPGDGYTHRARQLATIAGNVPAGNLKEFVALTSRSPARAPARISARRCSSAR